MNSGLESVKFEAVRICRSLGWRIFVADGPIVSVALTLEAIVSMSVMVNVTEQPFCIPWGCVLVDYFLDIPKKNCSLLG